MERPNGPQGLQPVSGNRMGVLEARSMCIYRSLVAQFFPIKNNKLSEVLVVGLI